MEHTFEVVKNHTYKEVKTMAKIKKSRLIVKKALFYIIKPLLEWVIDSPYKKLKILKRMLVDVEMLDFLK
ncbi:hypothetical protein ACQKNC_09655 [Lysinibacillus sp. NPDC094177]|uniref:hypothetical protein n=1 Tax=Lysinibacillus sp. NPDC094177 TaxID=3390580 RepID=UPI003D05EA3B